MSAAVDNPTTAVRAGEELDWVALDQYLKKVLCAVHLLAPKPDQLTA